MSITLHGLPAAPGTGIGTTHIHYAVDLRTETPFGDDEDGSTTPRQEWQRFLSAQAEVDRELERLGRSLNHVAADIFSVHRLILTDKTLTESIRDAIQLNQASAVSATRQAVLDMAQLFRDLDDAYFAGRAADILDIGRRLLLHLGALIDQSELGNLPPATLLLAEDLTPTDVALLPVQNIVGIGLAYSTPTAHSAILARSLGLPLVCGLGPRLIAEPADQPAILDGHQGKLIIAPSPQQIGQYNDARALELSQQSTAREHAHEPAITRDGNCVPVYINANTADDVAAMAACGADGVGLTRTEYLFQGRAKAPTVTEQREVYAEFGRQVDGRLLTIRALDAGGDKQVEYLIGQSEENPFLGLRGMRLLLAHPLLLSDQYRALLLSTIDIPTETRLRFMLPMVSTVAEMEKVTILLRKVQHSVEQEHGIQLGARVQIGALIEVPAAALMAERIAEIVDFLSIGTNDLAQYVMASDRTNASVAALADPLHPAVLQLIARTCYAGKMNELPVSLCGEIGGNVRAVPLLLGLGITELSVPLPAAPLVKQAIRQSDMLHCRQIAESALRCTSAEDVRALLAVL
jgi:phosphoenolpyruvate-protein phosphotransferase